MDVQSELNLIAQTSGFSRAKLSLLLKEMMEKEKIAALPRKKRVPASPCTMYTEIKKNYTCLHCGERFSHIIKLTKEEDTAVINEKGGVEIINSKSPAEVSCVTSHCNACLPFVQKMTREELEERYLVLLSCTNLLSTPMLFGNKFTIEKREVKL